MTISLQDTSETNFQNTLDQLRRGYSDAELRGRAAPFSIPVYRWKGRSFQLTFGIEMEYQGQAQIIGWDPNEIMATATLTSPTNEDMDLRNIRLKHLSVPTPSNGRYRAVGLLGAGYLPKDIYNRVYSVELTVHTLTLISVLPGGFVIMGAWAQLAVGGKVEWKRTYEPPRPPGTIPLEGWKEEHILGDVHLIEAK